MPDMLLENGLYFWTIIIIIIIYLFYHVCKNCKRNDIKTKKINYPVELDKLNFGTLKKSDLEDDAKNAYLEDDINNKRNHMPRTKLSLNISGNNNCNIAGENQTIPYDTKSFLQSNIAHQLSTTKLTNNNNNNERSNNPNFVTETQRLTYGNITPKSSKKTFQKLQSEIDKLKTKNEKLKQEKLKDVETIKNLTKENKDLETRYEKKITMLKLKNKELNESNKNQAENYLNLQKAYKGLKEQGICETVTQTESNLAPVVFETHNTI